MPVGGVEDPASSSARVRTGTFHLQQDLVADLPATATVVDEPAERRRVLAVLVDEVHRRNGPDSAWPAAVLDEWVERSPLVRVTFAEDLQT